MSTFPLSEVITVSISQAPSLPQIPDINTLAIFTKDAIPATWTSGQAFAVYTDPTSVASDFGLNSNTYAIANSVFSQQPNPVFGGGYLVVVPRLQSPTLETTEAAIQRTFNLVFYFGILMDEELADSAPTAFSSLASYVQSIDKMLFYASSNPNDLNAGSILDLVRSAGQNQVRTLYYGSPLLNGFGAQQTQMFAGAYAGRALIVNFTGSETVITMNLKQLNNIAADGTLTQTQLNAAQSAGVDVYANLSSVSKLITSGANSFFDQVYNKIALKFALQNQAFALLAGTDTKIPMTDDGVYSLIATLGVVMRQFVNNGYIAAGAWPAGAPIFGDGSSLIKNVASFGWYAFATPVASLTQAQITSRTAPLIQIAALEAGAIHKASILVQVTI